MEITVNINAPGLTQAIEHLAIAMSARAASFTEATALPQTTAQPISVTYTGPGTIPTLEYPAPPPALQQPGQYGSPQPAVAPVAPPSTVPTTAPTYSLDQLAVAATQLMDSGRQGELLGLLSSFGVQALTSLPKEQYGAFATQLRAMGAKI